VAATAAVAAATVEAHLCLACFSEAMAAAESLLTRQTVSCLRDREIGFLLGSLSPALQAAAAHSTNTSSSSSSSSDSTTAAATAAAAAAAAAASVLLHSARLAGALLRHYAKKVKCAAAPLIALLRSQVRLLFALLAAPAAADHTDSTNTASSSSEHSCSAGVAAAAVSRLLEALLPHKEVFKHYAPALLAEYVLLSVHSSSSSSGSGSAAAADKQALLRGVFCLIDACGPGEIQQLHSALDTTGRALFQVLYGDYQRRHKYAGRI
jgi:Urb2/Npa2 family